MSGTAARRPGGYRPDEHRGRWSGRIFRGRWPLVAGSALLGAALYAGVSRYGTAFLFTPSPALPSPAAVEEALPPGPPVLTPRPVSEPSPVPPPLDAVTLAPEDLAATIPPPVPVGPTRAARLVSRIEPQYPELARTARLAGRVLLNAVISAEGRVTDVQVVEGNPVLTKAAIEAVRQWIYEPALRNGVPMTTTLSVTINFTMGGGR